MKNELLIANKHGAQIDTAGTQDIRFVVNQLKQQLRVNSLLQQRLSLSATASKFFDGSRDIYENVGYPTSLSWTDYYGRYKRQGYANRIVKAKPNETWRRTPVVMDGTDDEDATEDTPFVLAWLDCCQLSNNVDQKSIWHYLKRVDRLAGIHEYAVLLLGINDGAQSLSEPLMARAGNELIYLSTFAQDRARIEDIDLVNDTQSARYGLPEFYSIQLQRSSSMSSTSQKVHWSRIVHVAEELEDDELYGEPRLQPVYNNLINIEKAGAASGEAAYRMATRKIIISTKDGYQIGETEVAADQVSEMMHNLKDVVELEGYDVNVIDGQMVDPSAQINTNVEEISAATEIPKRILTGSERGELASSQDQDAWYNVIRSRQIEFAEPAILRPVIDRLIFAGVLPEPTRGVHVEWQELDDSNPSEDAEIAMKHAEVLIKLSTPGIENIIDPAEFIRSQIPSLPNEAIVDEAAMLLEEMREMPETDEDMDDAGDQPV